MKSLVVHAGGVIEAGKYQVDCGSNAGVIYHTVLCLGQQTAYNRIGKGRSVLNGRRTVL